MELLTIGSFARLSRLSLKALRLYDDLGLLPPAQVDPVSGYRLYHRDQLERARLVAWLRRLGMPLAQIRVITSLEPKAAADAVASYWARCSAWMRRPHIRSGPCCCARSAAAPHRQRTCRGSRRRPVTGICCARTGCLRLFPPRESGSSSPRAHSPMKQCGA
jgi:DNA-binding transcriptional MerR regulator